MSAPRTNVEKQERRHKGPLGGMVAVVVFAGILLVALGVWIAYDGNDPGDEAETAPATSPALTDPETAPPGTPATGD